MGNDFSLDSIEDREQEDARLRRRKLRDNATSVKRKIPFLTIILTLIFLTVIGCFSFVFVAPEKVIKIWPEAIELYEKAGIFVYPENNAPPPDVEIMPYASNMVAEGDIYKLTVSGRIVNRGMHKVTIPRIIGTLKDTSDRTIYTWSFCLSLRQLVRGQGVDYEYVIRGAPDATASAVVAIKWEKDADGIVIDTCPPLAP